MDWLIDFIMPEQLASRPQLFLHTMKSSSIMAEWYASVDVNDGHHKSSAGLFRVNEQDY